MKESTPLHNASLKFAAIGLNQQMLPVFFGLLLAAAAAWLFLSNRFYKVLRYNYPGLYERLGCPKLFMKKSLAVNFRVLKFIFRCDHETAVDPAVIRLCHGLRSLFCIYVICLAGCLLLLFGKLV